MTTRTCIIGKPQKGCRHHTKRNLTHGVVRNLDVPFLLVRLVSMCISHFCCSLVTFLFSNCTIVFSLVQRTMEAHEWRGSASPRGDQGTGTQGSPVGRRSRLVGGDREFRVADHPQVPDSGLEPRKTPTGKMASEQQAVPPLTSAALRGIAQRRRARLYYPCLAS